MAARTVLLLEQIGGLFIKFLHSLDRFSLAEAVRLP